MSWIGVVSAIISAAFPGPRKKRVVKPPTGLEGARVSYVSEGRSGKVVFSRGLKSFAMYYEFGGGDTVATIDVPTVDRWEKETGFAAGMRGPILEFIGRSVVRDQTSGGSGRFEVHAGYISIHG